MRNEQYLKFVRSLPCRICGAPSSAHHAFKGFHDISNIIGSGGLGMKGSDWLSIPLCHTHHTGREGIHTLGKDQFEKKFGLILENEIIATLVSFILK